MSKRHGSVTVQEYKNEGFLPEAFVNYLAHLGWNDDTDREIYSLADLEELFNLKQVSSSPACFDREKLLWFNGKYIRELSDEELFEKGLPFLGRFVKPDDLNESTRKWLLGLLALYKDRVEVLSKLGDVLEPYFIDPKTYPDESLREANVTGEAFRALLELKKRFINLEWTKEKIEESIKEYVKEKGIKFKMIAQPLRLVVTGSLATPGIFDTLYYVGREPTLRRLENFLANYQSPD
jgi:glutamyl/glutaminyl-tRNA synthetase